MERKFSGIIVLSCHVDSRHQSNHHCFWDHAAHLHFIDPCNFNSSQLQCKVVAVQFWSSLVPELRLTGVSLWLV